MKRLKPILTARNDKIKIHDAIEALIARMCDPTDILYNEDVANDQLKRYEDSEQR